MTEAARAIAIRVTGRVQGVNYRDFTRSEATRLHIRGWVVNREDGSVEAAFYGPGSDLAKLVELCRKGPPHAEDESLDLHSTDRRRTEEPPSEAYSF